MSEIKVNKITPKQNCTQVTLGDSGDDIVVATGVNLKTAAVKDAAGNVIVSRCGSNITIGSSGASIALACGASQTGFGRTGTVDWDTTAKTASFTAVSGNGYFVNTTSGAITVTLPATPSSGDIVSVSDYNGTASTNAITIARNGSNINGNASDYLITKADSAITFVYVDGTVGWTSVQTSNTADTQNPFIIATGGTETECGNYKIHTFTSPGTFTVTNTGSQSNTVDYLVVAGGGGGGGFQGAGGGGAGGYRESSGTASGCYTASPLGSGVSALPVTVTGYPITVGSGGAGGAGTPPGLATTGSPSIFSSITSSGGGGGGGGGGPCASTPGNNGGSGGAGGGRDANAGGTGNTPPVSPPQGNPGGTSKPEAGPSLDSGGGGGGATAAGANGQNDTSPAGNGGAGATSSINGSPTTRAGGGGGARETYTPGTGGSGGGGDGGPGIAGTINTGSGGGGGNGAGGNGGSGIVIIRYKYQ